MRIPTWMRQLMTFGAVAAMAVAMAACGGGGGEQNGGGEQQTETGAQPQGESGAEAQGESGAEQQGGTFSVGIIEPDFLHPGRSGLAFEVDYALFTPLMSLQPDGTLAETAAESVTSDDQQTWTIRIKPGWTFHDGTPVTAQHYVDSWNAVAYAPNGLENNWQLTNIEGYDELNPESGDPTAQTLSGLEVVDDTTFRVTLKRPDSQFPYQLTISSLGFLPLPPQALEDPEAFNEAPIGNGPYMMDGSWRHNQGVSVKRYPDYKGPAPNADGIDFRIYTDLKVAYRDVQADNLDIVNVGEDQLVQATGDFGERVKVFDAPAMDYLLFAPTDERLSDPRIRQAFSLAIDRDAITTALYGGLTPPATSLTSTAYVGGGTTPCDYCRFDPEEAKRLLAEAGGFSGPLTITYPGGYGYDSTFQAIGNQLRTNLGIEDVKLDPLPFAPFIELVTSPDFKGVARGHWGSAYPSVKEFISALFMPGGLGQALTGYENDEVTRLVYLGDAEADPDAAITNYQAAEALVVEDVAVAPLFADSFVYVHSNNVSDVIIDNNLIELSQVRVAQ